MKDNLALDDQPIAPAQEIASPDDVADLDQPSVPLRQDIPQPRDDLRLLVRRKAVSYPPIKLIIFLLMRKPLRVIALRVGPLWYERDQQMAIGQAEKIVEVA